METDSPTQITLTSDDPSIEETVASLAAAEEYDEQDVGQLAVRMGDGEHTITMAGADYRVVVTRGESEDVSVDITPVEGTPLTPETAAEIEEENPAAAAVTNDDVLAAAANPDGTIEEGVVTEEDMAAAAAEAAAPPTTRTRSSILRGEQGNPPPEEEVIEAVEPPPSTTPPVQPGAREEPFT